MTDPKPIADLVRGLAERAGRRTGRTWALPSTGPTPPPATAGQLPAMPGAPPRLTPPVYHCPLCKDAGFLRRPVGDPPGRLGNATEPCDCQTETLRHRAWRRAKESSRLTPGLFTMMFSNFHRERQPEAHQAAVTFAQDPERAWLVLIGPPGTGKTHLLAAAVNHLLRTDWHPAYLVVPEFLRHIQDGIERGTAQRRFDDIRELEVLLLDDLGAEQRSEWRDETLFLLLDYRWATGKPTAVATNLRAEDLPPRLASRLYDQARSRVVSMRPGDYRQSPERAAERAAGRLANGGGDE